MVELLGETDTDNCVTAYGLIYVNRSSHQSV
jgi:hypothetical protein